MSRDHDGYNFSNNFAILQKTKERLLKTAIIHYKAKHFQEALVACEQAIQIDDRYTRAYHGKILSLIGLKQYDAAISACRHYLQLKLWDSEITGIYAALGEAYLELKRYEEAHYAYERASENYSYAIIYTNKLNILIDEGKKLLGLKCYKEALEVFKASLLFGSSKDIMYNLKQDEFYLSQAKELFARSKLMCENHQYSDALFFMKQPFYL